MYHNLISKYEFLAGKDSNLFKAATLKRFEYSLLGKAFEKQTVIKKQTEVVNKKEDKRNKLLKTIIRTDEKYLPKEQVEKYVNIDKSMNPEDLVCRKHFNS